MDINTKEQLDAHIEFTHIQQIEKVENKLNKMRYLPASLFFIVLGFLFYIDFDVTNNLNGVVILLATMIGVSGQTSVQRTELLKELFELKYGQATR